ncbi:Transketolase [Prochlorococcus sp. SS52]|nr:Transketolase [Prochlorococcus marinus str. LG]KGG22226.1 Transketolase [Prochlorococcus marinus str. SS2]KGG24457.1 Transketolase [Prochlorococcus marinus str. SS35]KGG33352.1 Transketolase [Prochlorococcus marinus str. SS51]KGG35493.1 Transketolase [Prochlorococcus sp. SS52]
MKEKYDFEFVLSKGHCLLAWLVTLIRIGELDKSILESFYLDNSSFGGHPKKGSSSSITWSTGSLGHGLSITLGKAFASPNKNFICVLGDGETNEGSVWEALMFMSQHKLTNVLVIIDNNKQESLTFTDDILSIENLNDRLKGFGLKALRIDGHDHEQILDNLLSYFTDRDVDNVPKVIIADTIKGKGISFMEKVPKWHHRKLTPEEHTLAIEELTNCKV